MKRAPTLLALTLALTLPAPAAAAPGLAGRIEAALRPLGSGASAQVTDLSARRSVVAVRARRNRPLGSTTKLLTAAAALRRLGTGAVLSTEVLATGPLSPEGVLAGDLVLRGGGDPLLDDSALSVLATRIAAVREVSGSIVGDETLFDAVRTGPSGNGAFDPELGGPLSALAFDRGAQVPDGPPQTDPARAAAARFDDLLEADGVVIHGVPRAGAAPPGAALLAAVGSRPLSELVAHMLAPSDDWIAELLTKAIAARRAPPGTTAAGAALIRREARRLGARVRLVDGSGLDGRDRGTAKGLVAVLRRMRATPAFVGGLARPGRAGTLRERLTRGPARRRCRGKTGTLPSGGVSVLAGYCEGRNGHRYAFAVLMQGRGIGRSKRAQDRVARMLASAR